MSRARFLRTCFVDVRAVFPLLTQDCTEQCLLHCTLSTLAVFMLTCHDAFYCVRRILDIQRWQASVTPFTQMHPTRIVEIATHANAIVFVTSDTSESCIVLYRGGNLYDRFSVHKPVRNLIFVGDKIMYCTEDHILCWIDMNDVQYEHHFYIGTGPADPLCLCASHDRDAIFVGSSFIYKIRIDNMTFEPTWDATWMCRHFEGASVKKIVPVDQKAVAVITPDDQVQLIKWSMTSLRSGLKYSYGFITLPAAVGPFNDVMASNGTIVGVSNYTFVVWTGRLDKWHMRTYMFDIAHVPFKSCVASDLLWIQQSHKLYAYHMTAHGVRRIGCVPNALREADVVASKMHVDDSGKIYTGIDIPWLGSTPTITIIKAPCPM